MNLEAMAKVIYEDINPWRGGWINASPKTQQRYLEVAAKAARAGEQHETQQV